MRPRVMRETSMVVDESTELPRLAIHDADGLAHPLVGSAESEQQLAGTADGRQRVSQLVSQHGQECLVTMIGQLQRLFDAFAFSDAEANARQRNRLALIVRDDFAAHLHPTRRAVGTSNPNLISEPAGADGRLVHQTTNARFVFGMHRRESVLY